MMLLAEILVAVVALLHIGFLVLEMFLWQTATGRKIFHLTPEFAEKSAGLAKNQGFYNGILAAGLIWSFFIGNPEFQLEVRVFFLLAVIAAGLFGALTVKRSILYIQALPAFLALLGVLFLK